MTIYSDGEVKLPEGITSLTIKWDGEHYTVRPERTYTGILLDWLEEPMRRWVLPYLRRLP